MYYKKVEIKSESDLPKEGLYFCAITDDCFGSFHFNPDDKEDFEFWIGNVMWYLIEQPESSVIPTDDYKQYITNLLYAAYNDGKQQISTAVFDLFVEEQIEVLKEFQSIHPQSSEREKISDDDIERCLENLIFTASKLWDRVKNIKDTDTMTVTHPIIEEAKFALKAHRDGKIKHT
jgi:hypothetical protein